MLSRLLFLLLVQPLWAAALDDRSRFYEALDHRDFGKMERTLKNWEKGRSENVEVLVARGLYFQAKAQKGKKAPTPVPAGEEVLLIHPFRRPEKPPKTFERLDPKLAEKAGHYWRRAAHLHPWRLDLYFKLAQLYGGLDDFESQNDILGRGLLYAEKNRRRLKWENNEELPLPLKKFVTENIGDFIEYYFAQHRREEETKALRLSKLLITFCPENPYGYNFIAVYFSHQPDWPYALKYLMLAYEKSPRNSLVLNNLGSTLLKLGKKKEARHFFKEVVSLNQDEEMVRVAK